MGLSSNRCPETGNGEHCGCSDAQETGVCCYCRKNLSPSRDILDPVFEDDGSEENTDA